MWFAGHPNGQSITAASKRRSIHNSLTIQFGLDGTAVIESLRKQQIQLLQAVARNESNTKH